MPGNDQTPRAKIIAVRPRAQPEQGPGRRRAHRQYRDVGVGASELSVSPSRRSAPATSPSPAREPVCPFGIAFSGEQLWQMAYADLALAGRRSCGYIYF